MKKLTATLSRRATLAQLLPLGLSLLAFNHAQAGNAWWWGTNNVSVNTNWSRNANWSSAAPGGTYASATPVSSSALFSQYPSVSDPSRITVCADAGIAGSGSPLAWGLCFIQTNGFHTMLIPDGVTVYNMNSYSPLGTGGGFQVGAGTGGNPGTFTTVPSSVANATNYVTIKGLNGTLMCYGGDIRIQQQANNVDNHYAVLDMSGLGTFFVTNTTGNRFRLVDGGTRSQGAVYLAQTNTILTAADFQVGYVGGSYSNSLPIAVYLGQTNWIQTGCYSSGNNALVVGYTGCTNALMTFRSGLSAPAAYFSSPNNGGRINTVYICNPTGGRVPGYALCDFTGGYLSAMVNNLSLGIAGNAAASGVPSINARGVLTFDHGTMDANYVTVGNQTVSGGGMGVGIINVGAAATLKVNNTLTLGAVTGTLTPGSAGTVNVTGGTLAASQIASGGGAATVNLTNATLALSVTPGSISTNVTAAVVTGGQSNTIAITFAVPPPSFPLTNHLILGTLGGAGNNFGLALPTGTSPAYAGFLTATANGLDLVVTNGPITVTTLTWSGADPSGYWDVGTTVNWLDASNNPVTYSQQDYVRFDDTASGTTTVSLQTTLNPLVLTVNNNTKTYTFTGGGSLSGTIAGGLNKQGTGTLVLAETGGDNFTGGVAINAGTLQVGDGATYGGGSLGAASGAVVNNGALVFNRPAGDTLTVSNAISGAGTLTVQGGSTVRLSGANTFSSAVLVTGNSTLQAGSAAALGATNSSTTIASGSTLDLNGITFGPESVTLQGTGVSSLGALVNNNTTTIGALTGVTTLAGDTTIGGSGRVDLAGTLSSGGQAYNLTIQGSTYREWNNLAVDPALGNITVTDSAGLGIKGSTTLGNPAGTLLVNSAMGVSLWTNGAVNVTVNKQLQLVAGTTLENGNGANTIAGPVVFDNSSGFGYCVLDVRTTSLTLNGALSGAAALYKQNGTAPLILNGNSPAFTGGVNVFNGKLVLNGTLGSGVTGQAAGTVAGSGTANGPVDLYGTLLPGDAGVVGTFTAGSGLTLEAGATVTFDLTANSSGPNDQVQVNGDLNLNGNNIIINLLTNRADTNGAYTLFTYTGALNGSLGTVSLAGPTSAYTFTITNVTTTTPKQLQLLVSGGPRLLVWNNAAANGEWDSTSYNWADLGNGGASTTFLGLDMALLDDSITTAATPTTSIDLGAGQVLTPSVVTNNSSTNYTLSGAGKLSGGASLVKLGSSTLTIGTTNDFTGSTLVAGGVLRLRAPGALGATNGVLTITNNATLDVNGYALVGKPVVVSGQGVGGRGAIDNAGPSVYPALTRVTLAGDTTFGNSVNRWDLRSPGGETTTPDTASLTCAGGGAYNLAKAGPGYFSLCSVTVDTNLANVDVLGGTFEFNGTTTGLGNPANTVTVYSNATFTYYNATAQLNKKFLLLDGATFGKGGSAGTNIVLGPVTLGTNAGALCTFWISPAGLIFSNVLSGPGSLVGLGGGPLRLAAANTYTGSTLINNGTLALLGAGSISASPLISIASGSTLDASGRADGTLTLAGGQTLSGSGTVVGNLVAGTGSTVAPGNGPGTLTVNGSASLAGTTAMEIDKTGGTKDLLSASTGVTYGGTLQVTFLSGTPAANDSFKLFSAPSYSGSFSSILPAQPGPGLRWDTSLMNAAGTAGGTLRVAAVQQPVISSITYSQSGIVLSGTNGVPGATYRVLESTNAALPLNAWVPTLTNVFGSDGSFSLTNAVDPNVPQLFFRLQSF